MAGQDRMTIEEVVRQVQAFRERPLEGVLAVARRQGPGRCAAGDQRRASGLEGGDRSRPGLAVERCTVHFLRDLRGHARKDQHDALGALIRQLFTASDAGEARRHLGDAVTQLQARLPKVAALLKDAEDDVLAFYAFPTEHWPKLRSTNPLERFNREIGRRTDVVGIFPDDAWLIRLVTMLAIEANDEWLVGRPTCAASRWSRCSSSGSIKAPRRSANSSRPEQPTSSPTSSTPNSYG